MTRPDLSATLREAWAGHASHPLYVAFSGGPDSTALLHALAGLPEARARSLCAIHVDHGLHPDSARWAGQCRQACDELGVTLHTRRVRVDTHAGIGIEAAARTARFSAFAEVLPQDAFLVTAHHLDDQAETVLLKLLRGAGPEGLGGMRGLRPFAAGWLWRPLLDTPRQTLIDYLRTHALASVDDPGNHAAELARNFLRHDVLPRLRNHWPRASRTLGHSARLQQQAADYLDQRAGELLPALTRASDRSLDATAWRSLHPALRGPVLDRWLHTQGFAAPSRAQREQLQQQIPRARGGKLPLVRWPGTAVHVWRGRLHAHPPLPPVPDDWRKPWHGEPLTLPAMSGTLELAPAGRDKTSPSSSSPRMWVRLGERGLRLRPVGDRHSRDLRDLFQQAGVPPWYRRRCPLIHASDGALLAVAGLCLTQAGVRVLGPRRPKWSIADDLGFSVPPSR